MTKSTKPGSSGKSPKGYWKYVYKSAKTGEFVTEAYAKAHPATTVREKIWVPG